MFTFDRIRPESNPYLTVFHLYLSVSDLHFTAFIRKKISLSVPNAVKEFLFRPQVKKTFAKNFGDIMYFS